MVNSVHWSDIRISGTMDGFDAETGTMRRRYRIDLEFIEECSRHATASKIVLEYLLQLHAYPNQEYSKDFHCHYATRMLRVLEDAPKQGAI